MKVIFNPSNLLQKAPRIDLVLYDSVAAEENFEPVAAEGESLDRVDFAFKGDFEEENVAIRKDFPETFIWDKIDEYERNLSKF